MCIKGLQYFLLKNPDPDQQHKTTVILERIAPRSSRSTPKLGGAGDTISENLLKAWLTIQSKPGGSQPTR
jgi:hypothetical protein